MPRARPIATTSAGMTSVVKPTIAKFARWTLSSSPVATSLPPESARISGNRNEPPISISSPRDTTISRFVAIAASANTIAAALLLTTIASSAPESLRSSSRR